MRFHQFLYTDTLGVGAVTAQPGGRTGVVDVGEVVVLDGLVMHSSQQLESRRVVRETLYQALLRDLQRNREINILRRFLRLAVLVEHLQLDDQNVGKLLNARLDNCVCGPVCLRAGVSVNELLFRKILQSVLQVAVRLVRTGEQSRISFGKVFFVLQKNR